MYAELQEDRRVKQIAESTYHAGRMLAALFKNGSLEQFVYYFNPKDIAETIRTKFGNTLFLYSVLPWENAVDKGEHAKALERQEESASRLKQSLIEYSGRSGNG